MLNELWANSRNLYDLKKKHSRRLPLYYPARERKNFFLPGNKLAEKSVITQPMKSHLSANSCFLKQTLSTPAPSNFPFSSVTELPSPLYSRLARGLPEIVCPELQFCCTQTHFDDKITGCFIVLSQYLGFFL